MKSSIQLSLALLSTLLSPIAFASPVPNNSTTTVDPNVIPSDGAIAPHSAAGAAVINPGVETPDEHRVKAFNHAASQKCITFYSEDPNWYYRNDGPWSGSGQFGSGKKTICVSRSNSAGGAMFISSVPGGPAGSTKLECFFPTTGTANCDVSLVDGFSLAVACKTARGTTPTIGGNVNLWKRGPTCNNKSQVGQGICRNDLGYQGSEAAVSPFFQNAVRDGNHYCIWANCHQDYFFNVEEELICKVTHGKS